MTVDLRSFAVYNIPRDELFVTFLLGAATVTANKSGYINFDKNVAIPHVFKHNEEDSMKLIFRDIRSVPQPMYNILIVYLL